MWWECEECPFQTNSPIQASMHESATGHSIEESEDA